MKNKYRSVLLLVILLASIFSLGCKEEKVFDADETVNRDFAKSLLNEYYPDLAENKIEPFNDSVNDLIGVWEMIDASWNDWQDYLEYYVIYNDHCIWITSAEREFSYPENHSEIVFSVFDIGEIVNASDKAVEYKVLFSIIDERDELLVDNYSFDGENIVFTWIDEETSDIITSTFTRVKEIDFPELDKIEWNGVE